MIKAVAIDDEPPALSIIEHFCAGNSRVELVKTFTDAAKGREFLLKNPVDLLFIDIQMPGYNGIEFYKNLPEKPSVIFTTAFSEYAVDGFNVNAVDYLLKPYTEQRFNQAIQKAVQHFKLQIKEKRILTLRTNYSIKSIEIDNIQLIESFDDYITIRFANGEPLEVRMTLKKIMELLPADEFIRVHRSFIVSFKCISEVRNKTIFIGKRKIPVSSTYEKEFFDRFQSI